MGKKKRQISWILCFVLVFMIVFQNNVEVVAAKKTVKKVKKIGLNHKTASLPVGKTLKLKVKFTPKKTTQKKILWKSANKKIATVSAKGVVKAKKVGKTTITAKVVPAKKKAVCKITVLPKKKQENSNIKDEVKKPENPTDQIQTTAMPAILTQNPTTQGPVVNETSEPMPTPSATPLVENKIYIDEVTFWDTLLEFITFGHYEADRTVYIESSLANKTIYYYIDQSGSTDVLSQEELEQVSWIGYDKEFVLENTTNVVYAKIVNNEDGTVYYLCSDGIDTTIPANTPEPSATPTVAPTPSATPTVEPTPSTAPSATPTVKPTPSATPTVEPTPSATPTVKPTPSATPTVKPTPSVTPTVKPTPSATPTVKPTPSATPTVEPTPSATPTVKPTPSATPTVKPTPSATPTVEPTPSATPTVFKKIDLSKVVLKEGMTYDEETGTISVKDVLEFAVPLGYEIKENHAVWLTIKGKTNTEAGFRCRLSDAGTAMASSWWSVKDQEGFTGNSEFEYTFSLTAEPTAMGEDAGAVEYLHIKGQDYLTNLQDIQFSSIEFSYPLNDDFKETDPDQPSATPSATPVVENKIYIDEVTFWDTLLEFITFGHYEADRTVHIESSLANKTIYYYIDKSGSTEVLSQEELEQVSWIGYDKEFVLENTTNVVYAKIVNNEDGTVYYLCSDGIDTTIPANTPEPSAAPTVAPTPSATPTVEPTPSATPTVEPTPSATPTVKPTPSATPTVKPTPSATPTVEPTPSTTPTVKPTPGATPTVFKKIDLSQVVLKEGMTYDEETGTISVKDVLEFVVPLGYEVKENDAVWLTIKGKTNTEAGFRCRLSDAGTAMASSWWSVKDQEGFTGNSEFEYTFQLIAEPTAMGEDAGAVEYLHIKGQDYTTNLQDIEFTSIEFSYPLNDDFKETDPNQPSAAPSSTPVVEPTPSVEPTTPPKYERPEVTAEPVKYFPLTEEGAIHNESPNGAQIVKNEDDSISVVFSSQYAAINFYLPDTAQNYYSNYKSVVLTYTCEGSSLGHALYDADMLGTEKADAGKHADWSQKIKETSEEKTLIFPVTNDCVGGCIRGFQIFNPNKLESGQTIDLTIKSLIFCEKENPTEEDWNPTTPTPIPTILPTWKPGATREPNVYGINGPTSEDDDIVWDSISFGSYYQSLYEPKQLPENPVEGTEYADTDGTKMMYVGGSYYKKEPIRWRVLSVHEGIALLVTDQNIDSQAYYTENDSKISWQKSSIREWLNGDFCSQAFNSDEKDAIVLTNVSAEKNPEYNTDCGVATTDSIYLLSAQEVRNSDYGFAIEYSNESETRRVKNTDFAKARGAWTNDSEGYEGNGWWWLRSAGSFTFNTAYVGNNGLTDCSGFLAVNTGGGVRPALRINLDSAVWSNEGKVGTKSVADLFPTPTPTESPEKQIDVCELQCDQATYDIDSDTVTINDTRSNYGDTTFMYFPLPKSVAPGEKVKVTISGPSWGTADFRVWTTPKGNTGAGDYVVNSNIYLQPTINADGSYTGTVEITAQNGTCDCISLKAGWGTTIQNLVISEIKVLYEQLE